VLAAVALPRAASHIAGTKPPHAPSTASRRASGVTAESIVNVSRPAGEFVPEGHDVTTYFHDASALGLGD
jgi:hypothetical protein